MSNDTTTRLVLGRPGDHALGLYHRHALTALAAAGAAALCLWQSAAQPLLLVGTLAGFVVTRHFWSLAARARVGARSEQRVAKVLVKLAPAAVVHGADLGSGGDADHVVLGPVCAVIETKTGRGNFTRKRRGDQSVVTVGTKTLPRDPVRQVRRQAQLLSRQAGRPVAAVVCVVDMTNGPIQEDGVWVCSLGSLANIIHQLPQALPEAAAAQRLAQRLVERAADAAKA
jgi:hypothetical protein